MENKCVDLPSIKVCLIRNKFAFFILILICLCSIVLSAIKQSPNVEYRLAPKRHDFQQDPSVENGKLNPTSQTQPSFYPLNGTGRTVDISKDVDVSFFNSFCGNTNLSIILPVYSATINVERRTAIRQTYGKTCTNMKQGCKLFFIIGVDLNRTIFEKVKQEYYTEKDILLIDKVDTYRDLNNKAVAMVDWIDRYCDSAKYAIHTIDDTYPNLEIFLQELETIKEKDFIFGICPLDLSVFRSGKMETTPEEYPYPNYPMYVYGMVYAFSISALKPLKSAFYTSDYIWIEDVWINGHVRIKAGVKAIQPKKHYSYHNWAPYPNTIFYHPVSTNDFYRVYSKFV